MSRFMARRRQRGDRDEPARYCLHLSNVDAGTWRATFSHGTMTAAEGFGTGETPWKAVQEAARAALTRSAAES
jgi:hypothetical protein